jgi:hypothetical protein
MKGLMLAPQTAQWPDFISKDSSGFTLGFILGARSEAR